MKGKIFAVIMMIAGMFLAAEATADEHYISITIDEEIYCFGDSDAVSYSVSSHILISEKKP